MKAFNPSQPAEAQHFRPDMDENRSSLMHTGIKTFFKVIAWTVASIILLLVAIALLIQIPAVQLKLTQKAVSFIEDKIQTEVALEGISIRFPKVIVLKGLYLEDQQGDTLFYAGRLGINTDLWALARNEIQLNDIALENTAAFIDRPERDSAYNFTYIIDAFAGDSTAVPDTLEQEGWNFSLKRIALRNIRVRYHDLLAGNHANVSLGAFELEMNAFDLGNNRYGVEDIALENTRASFKQTKLPAGSEAGKENADSTTTLVLSLKTLALSNVHLDYQQTASGQAMQAGIGTLKVVSDQIDLQNESVSLNNVTLENSSLAYRLAGDIRADSADENNENIQPRQAGDSDWKIALSQLSLAGNSIRYDNDSTPTQEQSFDFNHLWLTEINIDASDLRYKANAMHGDLHNLSFREQSGFLVNSMEGKIDVTETDAHVKDFLLQTGGSRIQLQAAANFASLENIGKTFPEATLAVDINESQIQMRDVLYFQPSLRDSLPLSISPETALRLDAALSGSVNNLDIRHLVLRVLSETSLRTSGNISGFPEAGNLRMSLVLDKFYTTRDDLEKILPDTLLPDSMRLPNWVDVKGAFQGSMEKAAFNALVTSSDGTIDVHGDMNLDSASALRGLNATLRVADLAVGSLLGKPDSVIGTLTMEAEIHANGLSPKEMNGTLSAVIEHFDYLNYTYRNLEINGNVKNNVLSVDAALADDNLNFTLETDYAYGAEVPRYQISLDLKNADFEALNLSASPIRGRGILMVNIATPDFKVLNGNVGIRKVAIFNGDDLYAIDSLLFASIDQEGRSEINIDSDLLAANFEGSINLFSLPGVVREYFNSYYSLHDSLDIKDAGDQHFSFDIQLKNTDLLTGLLVPGLTTFVPGKITGEFDSDARLLDLRMEIDELQYANIGVRSFVFTTNSNAEQLNYNFLADRIMIDSMKIDGLEFNGTVANDSIRTNLIILDSIDTQKYLLGGTFYSRENGFEFRLSPEDILLNYQNWSVPKNNYMRFGGEKFIAQGVTITNRREQIIIESKPQPGSPVYIGFRELNLEYLVSMIAEERPLSGLLHGDINLYPDSAALTFTSDITIADLRIRNIPWGNLSLQVEQTIRNRFEVDFGLTGNGNEVTARGFYAGGDSAAMDLTARIRQFNLTSLQPLLVDQVQDLSGNLTGEIRAKGTPEKPDIDGGILLRKTQFHSIFLNTSFSVDNETISFIDEGISFDAFEVADENANKARLNGTILTTNYRNFRFNLDLFTDRFRLLDTRENANALFYGLVEIEANARIRGDMITPVVDLTIGLSETSHLTYVVPQSEAAALKTEGIVKFVDKTFEGDPFMMKLETEASDTIKSTFRGIDLTARIELSEQEKFTIIIDPLTQDQLTISGNATMTLSVDPTGDINLTGRYEISQGTYNLSFYKFVKREFEIEKGSTITWTGDPLNAEMDIHAIYAVETAPIELFSNQLTGADPSEVNRYKQRLPFLVFLNISGQLLQPEISFKLEMPLEERNVFGGNVYARIQDINTRESDLNKQVFALLILKRFIANNPFESSAGGGLASTARRSVSKILSEQLNRLSDNIKGVELSFDIKSYEDYTSGQAEGQTELELGFSKSLLDDRLVVKLSGNIDIEGHNANQDATDYIGDLALEYKLTPDGRFRITGFRNSNYDMIDGELIETGVGLIYVKDYNSLRELFKANAETRN